MRILLVNKFLYPKGGDAISTLATGDLLQRKGHRVLFWGMEYPENPHYPTNSYFIDYIDYKRARGLKEQIKAVAKLLYSVEAKSKVESLIQVDKPDIAHLNNFAHQISPSILDVFKKYAIPMVMTMRDYKLVCPSYNLLAKGRPCERCKGGRYYHAIRQYCHKDSLLASALVATEMTLHHHILHIYKNVDIFISPSRFLKEKVKEMGLQGEIIHLPNFVDSKEYEPSFDWKERNIVYFGRLSKEKGLLTLIEAVKGLDVQLDIIGEGPEKAELENKIDREGINNVHFLGYRKGKDLHDEIKKSMFVVLPSEWYENNPRSAIEAFALGKPVIGANIGGIPELVRDHETGLLFASGNIEDLRNKIQWLGNNSNAIITMGNQARTFVDKELNPERHYAALMRIYDQAISKHPASS